MFRHTFVQRALDSGMYMRQVAAAIGDTELICQRHYSKWNKRGQEQLNKQLSAVHAQDVVLQKFAGKQPVEAEERPTDLAKQAMRKRRAS
jgi:hypothetical protein